MRVQNCLDSLRSGAKKSQEFQSNSERSCFIGNERGSAALVGILIMGILTSYLYYQLLEGCYSLTLIKERSHSYLCYRQVSTYFKSYVEVIAGGNLVIDAALAATALTLGALSPKTIHIIRTTKQLQDITHLLLIFKVTNSKYCTELQKISILRELPYKTTGLVKLKRTLYNAVTRKNSWNLILPPSLERLKVDPLNALAIKIGFRLAGFFDPLLGYEASEVSAEKYWQLNSRSGWSLSR